MRSRSEALAFLNHDDLWPPERNAALLEAWRQHPEADVVCGAFRLLIESGASNDERLRRATVAMRRSWLAGPVDPG